MSNAHTPHATPQADAPALRLSYVVIEARRPDRWRQYCADVLGLPEPDEDADGSLGWSLGDGWHGLVVRPGPADDLAALGLQAADERVLDQRLARLRAAGVTVGIRPVGRVLNRHVRRLHALQDPAGNFIELCHGQPPAAAPLHSRTLPGGFRAGRNGFGHVALVAQDLAAMEDFYVRDLGFGVTDRLATRVGPLDVRGTFLHCNARHHSVALMGLPLRRRLHHLMIEANDWRDIGTAYERARSAGLPLSMGLGQHPDPDGTFSFYGAGPSGFDVEIGAGSREIDVARWQETRSDTPSRWGHEPQWHLKWTLLKGLVASWMSPARQRA